MDQKEPYRQSPETDLMAIFGNKEVEVEVMFGSDKNTLLIFGTFTCVIVQGERSFVRLSKGSYHTSSTIFWTIGEQDDPNDRYGKKKPITSNERIFETLCIPLDKIILVSYGNTSPSRK